MYRTAIYRSAGSLFMLGLLCLTGSLMAQSEDQIKKFNEEREAYFTEKLELTETEARAFWPLYYDYQNRRMKIHEDERNTFRYCSDNADNMEDDEVAETLEKVLALREERNELEQEYYGEKFLQALSPKKVMMLYRVEMDFRRHLIRKIRGNGEGRQGHGPGKQRRIPGGGPGPGDMLPLEY